MNTEYKITDLVDGLNARGNLASILKKYECKSLQQLFNAFVKSGWNCYKLKKALIDNGIKENTAKSLLNRHLNPPVKKEKQENEKTVKYIEYLQQLLLEHEIEFNNFDEE